jgi:hypothetical protein
MHPPLRAAYLFIPVCPALEHWLKPSHMGCKGYNPCVKVVSFATHGIELRLNVFQRYVKREPKPLFFLVVFLCECII